MSKLGHFCERVVEAGWLTAIAATPLYFDVYSSRVFEPDKIVFLRCLVLMMLLAQAVAWSERPNEAATRSSGAVPAPKLSLLARWRAINPLLVPVLVFIGVELLATLTSIAPLVSLWGSYQRLEGTYTLLTYIAMFFLIVANLRTRAQLNRVLLVAIMTSLPISLYGFIQHFQLDPLPWGGDVTFRVTSTLGNAIFLAAYLIMVVPLTAARLVAAVREARVPVRPDDPPIGPTVRGWVAIVFAQNVLLSILLVGHTAISGLWWALPGFIGLFVLLTVTQSVATPSPRLARIEAAALAVLLVLQIVCIFLTQSRGPWLGLFAGAVVFVLLLELWGGRNGRLVALTVGGLVVAGAILLVFNLPGSPLARFRDVPYVGRLGQLGQIDDGTGRVRVLIWEGTYVLMTQHPTIGFTPDPLSALRDVVGYGPDAMQLAYNPVYPPALGDLESRNASPDRNHNDLLDHLVMTGVLGLVAYLFLVAAGLRLGFLAYLRSANLGDAALVVGLLAALMAHLVETQTGIAIVSTQSYFWVILALFVVLVVRRDSLGAPAVEPSATLPPIAGGAPTATKSRKGARRGPNPPTAVAAPVPTASSRRWVILLAYAGIVVVGQFLLAQLAAGGIGGGQMLMFGSFLWIALALPTWAWCTSASLDLRAICPRTQVIGGIGLLVVLVAIVLNLNQLAADVYHKQGTSLDGQQRFAESTHSYGQALQLAPQQSYYALYMGRAFLEIAKQAGKDPMSPPFQPTLSTLLDLSSSTVNQFGQPDALAAAQLILEHARDLDPLDPDHYANLARLYRLWGETLDPSKLTLAVQNSQLATQLSPHSTELYDEWALALLDQQKFPEAQQQAETAVQIDPQYATAHLVLGDVFLQEHNLNQALAQHLVALQLDPNALSDATFEQRVSAYVQGGKGQALADAYAQVLKTDQDRGVRLAYGYVLSQIGQTQAGIAQFREVVASDPTDWVTWRNLAIAYNQAHDSADALSAAQNALHYAPPEQQQSLQDMVTKLSGTTSP